MVGRWAPDFAVATPADKTRWELARDGRPLLVDPPTVARWRRAGDKSWSTVAVLDGLVDEVPAATALLVRPDGYVAWASSLHRADPDELRELRCVLTHWFGI